jgi:hypothetical protein
MSFDMAMGSSRPRFRAESSMRKVVEKVAQHNPKHAATLGICREASVKTLPGIPSFGRPPWSLDCRLPAHGFRASGGEN